MFQCFDLSAFCSGTLKREIPSGSKQQPNSFYNKGGQRPPDSAPTPCLCSDLCLPGRNVRPSPLHCHQNKKRLLTLINMMHKHIKKNGSTDANRFSASFHKYFTSSVYCVSILIFDNACGQYKPLINIPSCIHHTGVSKNRGCSNKTILHPCCPAGLQGHILDFPS